nr:amino acid ABC transporter substrate-binding protein [Acetobacteraceae bacterium]
MTTLDRRTLLGAAGGALAMSVVPVRADAQTATFRIGALNPVTGAGSPYGSGMQKMILAAVEEVNA